MKASQIVAVISTTSIHVIEPGAAVVDTQRLDALK
jgi:hypothetical protein